MILWSHRLSWCGVGDAGLKECSGESNLVMDVHAWLLSVWVRELGLILSHSEAFLVGCLHGNDEEFVIDFVENLCI